MQGFDSASYAFAATPYIGECKARRDECRLLTDNERVAVVSFNSPPNAAWIGGLTYKSRLNSGLRR